MMRINEVLLQNRWTKLDENEKASTWIELVNVGTRTVDLSGFSITNDVTVPRKWPIPSQEVSPGGYQLVWLSGKDQPPPTRELHANFELSRRGETLMLVAPDGTTSDALFLLPQSDDRSYGRFPDGLGRFRYLLFPTPEEKNREPAAERPFASRLQVQPNGGRYDGRIEVEMTMPLALEDVEIRYTTDGNPPTSASLLYAQPVVMSPASTPVPRVLRAAAFYGDRRITPIETHSYFLDGEPFGLPTLSVLMGSGDFWRMQLQVNRRGRESEHPAFVEVIDASGSRVFGSGAGIRLHGNAGRQGDFATKKSYRLYFRDLYGTRSLKEPLIRDEGYPLNGVVLRANNDDAFRGDPRAAYIRDQLIRELHEDMGQPAVHGAWYSLLVNFDFKGVYNVVERLDQDFLRSHIDPHVADWDILHDSVVSEGDAEAWDRLLKLMREHDLADEARYEEALELIDVVNFTDYMILNIWAQNSDWPHKNYYAARPRSSGGKWIFVSWDAESVLGLHERVHDLNTFQRGLNRGGPLTEMFSRLMRNPRYQELFVERFDRHMAGPLASAHVVARIRRLSQAIGPEQTREIRGRYSEDEVTLWRENIEAMVRFARLRPAIIRQYVHDALGRGITSAAPSEETTGDLPHAQ